MTQDNAADYAVIGVGSVAEAIVSGLSRSDEPPTILLSPRSRQRTARLAGRARRDPGTPRPGDQENRPR